MLTEEEMNKWGSGSFPPEIFSGPSLETPEYSFLQHRINIAVFIGHCAEKDEQAKVTFSFAIYYM